MHVDDTARREVVPVRPPTATRQDTLAVCSAATRRLSEDGVGAVPEALGMLSAASGCAAVVDQPGVGPDPVGDADTGEDTLRVPLREGRRLVGVLELTPAPPAGSPWAAGSAALTLFADVLAMSVGCARTAAAARTGAAQFLLADEADRAQLAAGLHDGLVQALVAARYLIDLAVQPDAQSAASASLLRNAREAVRDALAEARHLLGWLRPRSGSNVPVVPELESMVAREAARNPAMRVLLDIDPSADIPVPPVVAAAAYRLVQSAVDSAHAQLLHAEATDRRPGGDGGDGGDGGELHIGVRGRTSSFELTFPAELADGSCAAMARWLDRAKLLGGSARIKQGTLVVQLPVEPDSGQVPRLPVQRYEGYL